MSLDSLSLSQKLKMIRGVDSIYPKVKPQGAIDKPVQEGKVGFGEMLMKQLEETNKLGIEADQAMKRAAAGEELNPHATMIAVQKATIALTLLMGVKERIERVYQEVIRMPV